MTILSLPALSRHPFPLVAAIALAIWLSFGGFGQRDVTRKAESRLAQTAQEMLHSGDWVVPRLGGEPRLEKPPLMYWAIATVSLPTGKVTESTAMIPLALAGLGTVLIIMAWGSELGGRRLGIVAGLLLATAPGFYLKGHHIEAEIGLCFFVTLAMWLLARRWTGISESIWELLLIQVVFVLIFLTKGPPGILFPVVTFGVLGIIGMRHPEWKSRKNLWILTGCALAILAIIPWSLAVIERLPEAGDAWFREIFDKRVGDDPAHAEPFYFYIPELLPLMLPALFFLPRGIQQVRPLTANRAWAIPLVWFFGGFIAFSLVGGKRWYYLLPLFPPMALLTARGLVAWSRSTGSVSGKREPVLLGLITVAFIGAVVTFVTLNVVTLGSLPILGTLWAAMTIVLAIWAARRVLHARREEATCAFLLAGVALWTTYRLTFWPVENETKSLRPVADAINLTVPQDEDLDAFSTSATEFLFHLNRLLPEIRNPRELAQRVRREAPDGLWIVLKVEDIEDLTEFEYRPALGEMDGRPWEDFEFTLVRVTGFKASGEQGPEGDASIN